MQKRGISAVIATVFIILIAIVIIMILWLSILPLLKQTFFRERAALSIDTLEGYTFYDDDKKIASVQINRGSDKANLSGIEVIFSAKGESEKYILWGDYFPEINQKKTISYFFLGTSFKQPVEYVSVAPIYRIGVTSEVGDIAAKIKIPRSKLSTVPEVILYNYWCDSYDINKNGKIDFPGEAPTFLRYVNKNCSNFPEGKCCGGISTNPFCCDLNNHCDGYDVVRDGKIDGSDLGLLLSFISYDCYSYRGPSNECCPPTPSPTAPLCCSLNGWCSGTDYNKDGRVDGYDLGSNDPYFEKALCIPV